MLHKTRIGVVSAFLFALLASASPALANAINSANFTPSCSGPTLVVTGINLEATDSFEVIYSITYTPISGPATTVSGTVPVTGDAMGSFAVTIDLPPPPSGTSDVTGSVELFDLTTNSSMQGPIPLDFGPITCAAPGGCPATIGFWKNAKKHPFPAAVKMSGLMIGGVTYTAADLYTILGATPNGNAVAILGKQLVGALLNLAAGAAHNASADAAIADAEMLLVNNSLNLLTSIVPASSTLGSELLADATVLNDYNSGNFGTCSDGSGLTLGK